MGQASGRMANRLQQRGSVGTRLNHRTTALTIERRAQQAKLLKASHLQAGAGNGLSASKRDSRLGLVTCGSIDHARVVASTKRFQHLGQEWEAVGTGTGHGVGFGYLPNVDRWGVIFRSVSKPEQGDYRGTISHSDPAAVDVDELKRVLEEVLAIAAIDRSRFSWRTAEGIAKETGIALDRVRHILETTSEADVIQSDELDPQGHVLFTTQDHFLKTTGDVSKRYSDVERST